jgi:hypothetical protein
VNREGKKEKNEKEKIEKIEKDKKDRNTVKKEELQQTHINKLD